MVIAHSNEHASRWLTAILVVSALGCSDDGNENPSGSSGGSGNGGSPSGGSGGVPGSGSGASGGISGTGGDRATGGTVSWPQNQDNSPEIDVWYGTNQIIGGPGQPAPQRWVNVLGRITDPTAAAATYRVNGGAETSFPFGPSTTRLMSTGDFNLEIPRDALALAPEFNTVDILVERGSGDPLYHRVQLQVHPAAHPAPALHMDFADLEDISALTEVGAVVDGHWELTEDGVHNTEVGYDRLIALGSQSWAGDHEVLAEFFLHDWRNWGGIGLAVGWQGHEGEQDPREDWPLEALGWVRNVVPQSELQLMAFTGGVLARREFDLPAGNAYMLRLRTERTTGAPWVSLNIWPADSEEPADWLLEAEAPEHDGSVLLVTHHADVTWRTVSVTPL